jgi:hypothetical protein
VILLLNVWGGRRARLLPSETTRAVTDIKKCVDVLQLYEKLYVAWPDDAANFDLTFLFFFFF